MSYNTRRTGGGVGRTAPTTQVNYHQQQTRSTNVSQQARNTGYSTNQPQSVSYNNAAQPAYTTTPPQPQTQAKTASQSQPTQVQQPPVAKTPATVTPPAAVQGTPLSAQTPAVKQEPVSTPEKPKNETTENGGGDGPKQPFWKKRPFTKVSNRVRKARQNAKLRRILNPKNALTFLNELRPGGVKFVVNEDKWGYVASVDIDGKTFTGHAMSMSKAKVNASEQALKHLLLEQIAKSQQASSSSDKKEEKDDDSLNTSEDGGEPKAKKPKIQPEDEVPWGSLAAFALHKLFMEWQKEGPEVSITQASYPPEKYDEDVAVEDPYFTRRPGPPPPGDFGFPRRSYPPFPPPRGRGFGPYPPPRPGFSVAVPPRRLPPPPAATFLNNSRPPPLPGVMANLQPMKKIPEDANKRHPVMLLNQLKPNVIYNESREGEPPRVSFVISVEIDGKEYIGRGKNKKEAKKQAAKAALAPLGIIYKDDE